MSPTAFARQWLWVAIAVVLGLPWPRVSRADLILTLWDGGGKVVNYSATTSGSNVPISVGAIAAANKLFRLPTATSWNSLADDFIGNALVNGANVLDNDDLALSSPITYSYGGVSMGEFTSIDLDPSDLNERDSIELEASSNLGYPLVQSPAQALSWSGSGSFTLDGAASFDSFAEVLIPGTYSKTTNGVTYTVKIVPEPGGFVMGGLLLALLVSRRRRSPAP